MTDSEIETEVQAKGLKAPRVTQADIDENIVDIEIVKHVSKSGQILRWAVITTRNGFAVAGKPSCAVSEENDNAALGEKIAIANTRDELWPLMGYALKNRIAMSNKITMSEDGVIKFPKPDGSGAIQITLTSEQLQDMNAGKFDSLNGIDETQIAHIPV